jgi:ABC-type polysaccharide/polyol phosphate export permease
MNWNKLIRQLHRWLSILFTVIVAAIFIMLGFGREPAQWVYFLPLFPLFLMTVSGLYLFALPYVAKSRANARDRA